jgi:DNA repair protein RecN (Recombination protein N)
MLAEIEITNFAIIDHLRLRFSNGFNALTGETGAGKSIIIDAMSAMLGMKIGTEFVRHGTNQARVEGTFELHPDMELPHYQKLVQVLKTNELLEDSNAPIPATLILNLSRELNTSGRSVCRINGSVVKTDILREVGESLIDIHGQTEHVSLLRVSEHLELLDQYANVLSQRNKLSDLVGQLRGVRKEIANLQKDERELARQTELLKFQVDEITAAALLPGEEEELLKERQLLNSAEKLLATSARAYQILYQGVESDEAEYSGGGRKRGLAGQSISQSLTDVTNLLTELARFEPKFSEQLEAVQEATYKLEDVAYTVRDFRDTLEHDPRRVDEVEERLDTIRSLKRKYGNSIPEVIAFGKKAADDLSKIEHSEERLVELHAEEERLRQKIGLLAGELSEKRQTAAQKLAAEVEQTMRDLKLLRVSFMVNFNRNEDPDGVPVKDEEGLTRYFAFDGRGIDKAEFFVSLNPGEPPKPLQKVASGGETSRLMLALKSILAAADHVPTLIFDEVDVGVGGRSGQVVGEKLWQLTNNGQHQVLCITHLPQIAAFGDAHYNIVKQVHDERTTTTVRQLSDEERVEEIAAMLGGHPITSALRTTSQELINEVQHWKETAKNGAKQMSFANL